jgi:glycosyltransferase involved in cell wall biosynthesis
MVTGAAARHLLLFGWYRPGTGFTRVLEALLPFLAREFRITWYGVGYQGEAIEPLPGVAIVPTNLSGGDLVGAYAAAASWRELAPDAVLALNDLWYLKHYTHTLGPIRGAVPMVGYAPLDGCLDDPRRIEALSAFSTLVTYTESAATNLREVAARGGIALPVAVAGHGVDTRTFFPTTSSLDEKMHRARAYFGLPGAAFVVLNAARPDPRKRIDVTLAGFAVFARQHADAYLCLHHAIEHTPVTDALRQQAAALGIQDRVLFWPPTPGPLADADLNALYNACCVGINSAYGEGFGLVSFEHAATGAPQIVPGQAALIELWAGAAHCLPATPVRTSVSPLLMVDVQTTDVALALAQLRSAPVWATASAAALAHARQARFEWSTVAGRLRVHLQ